MALNQSSVLTQEKPNKSKFATLSVTLWQRLGLLVAIAGLSWLALYNLGDSPAPWFDEGEHLRVPKTLVQYGQYAVWSADGFRYFGPTIGVGPTVLLPITLSFKLFGIGLVQGRVVIVLYLALAIYLYWLTDLRLNNSRRLSLLSLGLLVSLPATEVVIQGRQGLGEVPALVFFLLGLLAWGKAGQSKQNLSWLLTAGACWALAAITKSDYGLLLPPALFLAWLVNRFYYRRPGWNWQTFLIPLALVVAGLGGWYLTVLFFLGGGDFATNLSLLRTASGGSAFVFAPARTLSAAKFLLSLDNFFGLPVLGLLYGLWLLRKKTAATAELFFPAIFCLVWLGWFVLASVGWPRYAFSALVVCPFFMARLLFDLPGGLVKLLKRESWRKGLITGIGLITLGLIGWGLSQQITQVVKVDDSAQRLAAYLNQNVSRTAVIETWESELGFLTDHRYHYPPPEMLDKAVRRKWLANTVPPLSQLYRPEKLTPDYLINGTFAAWNELYPPQLLDEHYQLVARFGTYSLYRYIR